MGVTHKPQGYPTVSPYLVVDGVARTIDFLVQAFDATQLTMFLAPLLVGGVLVGVFTASLHDRRLDPATRPPWSLRQLAGSFYVSPRANPDFAWAFASRFMLVMAYAFLVTYQAYYLINQIGIPEAEVAHQIRLWSPTSSRPDA